MTAHNNAAILKSYADNTNLVIFILDFNSKWIRTNPKALMDYPDDEFFACLPQHNENGQCLHWLNGGEIEYDNGKEWVTYDLSIENPKYPIEDFTGLEFKFRIKPRKEKRWVCITDDLEIEDGTLYESYSDADENSPGYKQIVEIEVEI